MEVWEVEREAWAEDKEGGKEESHQCAGHIRLNSGHSVLQTQLNTMF